jgi:hydroxyacylglutathione hydrolase
LGIDQVQALQASGALLLDGREPADFAAAHLQGAINVGPQGRFAEWAANVLPPDRDIALVGDPSTALEARVRLARVGYDRVAGQLDDPRIYIRRPQLIESSPRLTIDELITSLRTTPRLQLLDVRSPHETAGGTLPGATPSPSPYLSTPSPASIGTPRPWFTAPAATDP